jgi:hypothetical protein
MKLNVFIFLFVFVVFGFQLYSQDKLPSNIDHSASKYFPEVGNQGHIGACDWFAAVYYQMTYSYNRLNNRKADSTNTFSPKFGYSFLSNAGIFPSNIRLTDVYEFVKKHGCATQEQIPYDMANGTGYTQWCVDVDIWESSIPYRISDFEYFTMNNRAFGAKKSFNHIDSYLNYMKSVLADGEILVIQSEPFVPGKTKYAAATGEVHKGDHVLIQGFNGPEHTMAIVGYNDDIWCDINNDGIEQENEKGAIKIMDSFGSDFRNRNDGAFWMLYSTVEESIFEHRVNRMFVRDNYSARFIARVTMNTARRDKVKFQFGRLKNRLNQEFETEKTFDPYSLGFNLCTAGVSLIEGGGFAYDGSKNAIDGSFAFDLTDIYLDDLSDYWCLRVYNATDDPLVVKGFEIVDQKTGKVYSCKELPKTVKYDESYFYIKM